MARIRSVNKSQFAFDVRDACVLKFRHIRVQIFECIYDQMLATELLKIVEFDDDVAL